MGNVKATSRLIAFPTLCFDVCVTIIIEVRFMHAHMLYEDIIYIINLSSHSIFVHSAVSSIAHVNCGQCQTVLMYPYGAPSVKCAICNFITNVGGVC